MESFERYRMPDVIWSRMELLLPIYPLSTSRGGRPRINGLKSIADAVFYKMRTGCQWNAIPRVFGASSTIHDYFQEWVSMGIFETMWAMVLSEHDDLKCISWKHQSLDTSIVKSPLGGARTGPNPTDRGKLGCKRSVLVDGRGVPISCEMSGEDTHDGKLAQITLQKRSTAEDGQRNANDCIFIVIKDMTQPLSVVLRDAMVTFRILQRKKRRDRRGRPVTKRDNFRWIVERTHSWANQFRGLKIRWEKKFKNYEAFLHISFAVTALRMAGLFG